jgi:hypothetical protein
VFNRTVDRAPARMKTDCELVSTLIGIDKAFDPATPVHQ